MVAAIQRTAGNAAATRMIQRVPDEGGQQSATQSHQPYEQTVAEYAKSGGPTKLYRAIRITSQAKRSEDKSTIMAKADGDLGAGLSSHAEVTRVYQALKQWPEAKDIEPVDANATFTVAHHVAGDNYGTQYISFSPDQAASTHYARYNFMAGPAENMDVAEKPRAVKNWAPVIEIDVSKLGSSVRLVNLADPAVFDQTNLAENQNIASMAKNDREVLIKGTIPAGAVTKVFGVEDAIKELDLAARKNLIEREFKFGPRPPHGADRQSWDNMLKRNVPEHLQEYFGHLTEEPEEDEYVPFTSGAGRKRQAAAPPQSESVVEQPAKKKKKKKQQSAALLSFNMDED
ncbi:MULTISPECIES: hypothetical protein [unclassified Streptomyces]|uniref:DUF7587 domain-containing protein n=1 Tax=unclassified Streptomyces TaxID=2593676 RepID=UPI00331EF35F